MELVTSAYLYTVKKPVLRTEGHSSMVYIYNILSEHCECVHVNVKLEMS